MKERELFIDKKYQDECQQKLNYSLYLGNVFASGEINGSADSFIIVGDGHKKDTSNLYYHETKISSSCTRVTKQL